MEKLRGILRSLDRKLEETVPRGRASKSAVGSPRNSPHSSPTGSQVSDESIDANLTALDDLVYDHLRFLRGRGIHQLKEGLRAGPLYVEALARFRTTVTEHKQYITELNQRRDNALVLLYDDLRTEITSVQAELKNLPVFGLFGWYPRLNTDEEIMAWRVCTNSRHKLEDLLERFQASVSQQPAPARDDHSLPRANKLVEDVRATIASFDPHMSRHSL